MKLAAALALLATFAPGAARAQESADLPAAGLEAWEHRSFTLSPEELPLPPLDVLLPRIEETVFPPPRVRVRVFRFKGNTVFNDEALGRVVAPYAGRAIGAEELEEARLALTAHYVAHGYVNSGAVLEDQELDGGTIVFTVVEGSLSEVQVKGARWLRSSFIRRRIERRSGSPLDVGRLQEALLLLNDHPVIAKINADLQPAGQPGKSRLVAHVKERFPMHAGLELSNDRPASVGAEHLDFLASHRSLTGHGDSLDLRFGLLSRTESGAESSGLENFAATYVLPLSSWETSLEVAWSQNDFSVIEEPFTTLDIESRSRHWHATLRQPVHRTIRSEVALSLTVSHGRSETFLLGRRFSLSPGAVDGETAASVIRLGQEWSLRSQQQVLALRSSLHFGVDALGAKSDGGPRGGEFFAWLGQGQFVQRLGQRGAQLIVRGDFQWSADPLLSLEQLSIGGAGSVRGYRENQLVRDSGAIGSAELRVPVWTSGVGRPVLQLAAFYDIGAGWNVGEPTPAPAMIHSAGGGLIFTPNERVNAELYWAHGFTSIDAVGEEDLQDRGFHFRLRLLAF